MALTEHEQNIMDSIAELTDGVHAVEFLEDGLLTHINNLSVAINAVNGKRKKNDFSIDAINRLVDDLNDYCVKADKIKELRKLYFNSPDYID